MKHRHLLPFVILSLVVGFWIFTETKTHQPEDTPKTTVKADPRFDGNTGSENSEHIPADTLSDPINIQAESQQETASANDQNKNGMKPDQVVAIDPRTQRFFGKVAPFAIDDLPDGNLKKDLLALNPANQASAIKWLHTLNFRGVDAVESLRADNNGGIYYNCSFSCAGCNSGEHDKSSHTGQATASAIPTVETVESGTGEKSAGDPVVAAAAVPISSPPVYNSKPGSANTMYLDFNGAVITGKAWNSSRGVSSWTAKAYSSDGDLTTFSDAEQTFMRRVWERIAEDYAPFDINVTTDVAFDPVTYTGDKNKVAWNLFCPRVDANGVNLPHAGSGGIAYVGVFGISSYFSSYQPAFTKAETDESADIASEAGSHEIGHNMGLSHDTRSNEGYYGGHNGAGAPSWGPIMGTGYGRNVSQWSKGEYYDSKHADWNGTSYDNNPNTDDDLAIIAARTSYRTDDHGGTNGTATVITAAGDGSFNRTGIIERTSEADVFSFSTGAGSVTINANPFKADTSTWGGNLDINMELYNAAGALVASNNPTTDVTAAITTTLAAGTYYIHIKPSSAGNATGTGSPYDSVNTTRAGYTVYASIGKYTLSGAFILPGVSIAETGGTNVIEGGATDTYTISLGTAPTSNVTVSIAPNAQVTTSTSSVTFTTANWNTPQTVTVTAVNDSAIEGNHTGSITHTATSSDPSFNGISIGSVIVNITDNDNIELTAPNGGESWMAGSTQNLTWTSLMGGNVKIELLKNGSLNSTIIASTPNDGSHSWTIPVGQTAASDYKIRITSVETPAATDTSAANFSIVPMPTTYFTQNFDAASTMPSGWSNTSSGATWAIVTTGSHTPNNSARTTGPGSVASAYLTSESIAIPAGSSSIKFNFYHSYNLEDGWDGGVLEFSIDGGAWFDVVSTGSGASFASGGYLKTIPTNYSNPIGNRSAWTGNSGGYIQTVINLTDTAKYAGKSLRARWLIGTDNGNASSGWNVDTVTLTAVGSSLSVTYNGNGSTGGTVPVDNTAYNSGATATVLGNTGSLVKTGSTFVGWNTAADGNGTDYSAGNTFTVTANTVLYAKWTTLPTYTVTYNGNTNTGGTAPSNQIKVQGTNLTLATNSGNLVKTGYTFSGWNTAADGSGTNYAVGATYTTDANLNLFAKWTINTYTITYLGNGNTGGSVPSNQTKTHGVNITLATNSGNLVRTGATFAGWNTAADGTGTTYATSAVYSTDANLTLYAKWTFNTYTVTYNGNTNTGGTAPSNQTKTYGVNLTLATNSGNLVKTGYTFSGWNTAPDGSGTSFAAGATYSTEANLTLYAKWVVTTYTINYLGNGNTGGSVPSNQTKTYGVNITLATNSGNLVRTGATFAGWNTAADGNGTDYAVGATYTANANLTLYAKWTLDTYTVTYNGNTNTGGTAPGNQTKTYGVNLALASNSGNLVKTGHTFAGWNTNSAGTGTNYAAGANYTGNANLTLYAKWTIDVYTITYNGNGNTSGSVPLDSNGYNYGNIATILDQGTLTRTPKTFNGWNTAADGSGFTYRAGNTLPMTGSLTLYAQWYTAPAEIYEPFSDSDPSLTGNTPGAGLTNLWTAGAGGTVVANSLSFGTLPTSGNKISMASGTNASATFGQSLANANLLTNGTTLWFSFIVNTHASSSVNDQAGFAIGTSAISSSNNLPIAANQKAIGVTYFRGTNLNAAYWNGGNSFSGSLNSGLTINTPTLIVGKIDWGLTDTDAEVITLYKPAIDLVQPAPYTTYTAIALPQTTFTTISMARKGDVSEFDLYDEIRFGSTYDAVVGISTSPYMTWSSGNFARQFNDTNINSNPDGDSLTNLQEYAFGMDPTNPSTPSLVYSVGGEVSNPGMPVLRQAGSIYNAVFTRRKDYLAAGLNYTIEFSADLKAWESYSTTTGSVLTGSGSSPVEAVSIEFPATVPVDGGGAEQPPKFFRVGLTN